MTLPGNATFGSIVTDRQLPLIPSAPEILPDGLFYFDDFINTIDAEKLLSIIDKQPWLDDLQRRVQHYGFKYDYRARRIDDSMHLGPLPDWLIPVEQSVRNKTAELLNIDHVFDQAIVNEYEPGQGISPHVDCEPCFGEVVATLSLNSEIQMDFSKPTLGLKISKRLETNSLALLTGSVRYEWQHSIPARKSDPADTAFNRGVNRRKRRVSVTFRSVLLDEDGVGGGT